MDSHIDLCQIPAGTPPEGVAPNFVNPTTLTPALVSVGVVLGVISTVFCAGRIYVNRNRLFIADSNVNGLLPDFTIVAVVVNIAYTGLTISGKVTTGTHFTLSALFCLRPWIHGARFNIDILLEYKTFRHQWDIPVCTYTAAELKIIFVETLLFAPAFFFPKAAILLLYRQLFVIQRGRRIAINIGLVVILLLYLSNIPMAVIYNAPHAGQSWDSMLLTLKENAREFCIAGSVQSAIGAVLDIYIFILPLPILWKLQLPYRRRVQLVATFSTALLAVAGSFASLVFKIRSATTTDLSWNAALSMMCCGAVWDGFSETEFAS
ncbi:hypothetical protein PG984_013659 [Apiospora sp. TS-2023a]